MERAAAAAEPPPRARDVRPREIAGGLTRAIQSSGRNPSSDSMGEYEPPRHLRPWGHRILVFEPASDSDSSRDVIEPAPDSTSSTDALEPVRQKEIFSIASDSDGVASREPKQALSSYGKKKVNPNLNQKKGT